MAVATLFCPTVVPCGDIVGSVHIESIESVSPGRLSVTTGN